MIRTYSELITIPSFQERYNYLKLFGDVGAETFGYDRWLNQTLYRSREWKHVRDLVIVRDNGCDLAVPDYNIHGRIIIHHMNPITLEDVENRDPKVLDPEFLITTCIDTHNAIHYGEAVDFSGPTVRTPFDTCPWH